MVERGPYVSYANCGLPYHISGVIQQESSLLVANEEVFRSLYGIDTRTNCEAIAESHRPEPVLCDEPTRGSGVSRGIGVIGRRFRRRAEREA